MNCSDDARPSVTDADNYWRDKVPDCWAMVASAVVTVAILGTSVITAIAA